MKPHQFLLSAITLTLLTPLTLAQPDPPTAQQIKDKLADIKARDIGPRPNILLILADDQGTARFRPRTQPSELGS